MIGIAPDCLFGPNLEKIVKILWLETSSNVLNAEVERYIAAQCPTSNLVPPDGGTQWSTSNATAIRAVLLFEEGKNQAGESIPKTTVCPDSVSYAWLIVTYVDPLGGRVKRFRWQLVKLWQGNLSTMGGTGEKNPPANRSPPDGVALVRVVGLETAPWWGV